MTNEALIYQLNWEFESPFVRCAVGYCMLRKYLPYRY